MTPLPAVVTVPDALWRRAAHVGIERRIASWGWGDKHGYAGYDPIGDDIMGAVAEATVAWVLGEEWHEINSFKGPDVGELTQVRYSSHVDANGRPDGRLILRPGSDDYADDLSYLYVFVRRRGRDKVLQLSPQVLGYDAYSMGVDFDPIGRPKARFVEWPALLGIAAMKAMGVGG